MPRYLRIDSRSERIDRERIAAELAAKRAEAKRQDDEQARRVAGVGS